MQTHAYQMLSADYETPEIKRFRFARLSGDAPDWAAGAHVRVVLTGGESRAYSLLRLPDLQPQELALGVLLDRRSTGGSRFMHALCPGDQVQISDPLSHFALQDHEGPAVLIAGGVGITPILSMAAHLAEAGRDFTVHYAGRSAGGLAFVPQMQAICGSHLSLHFDDQENALNLGALLACIPPDAHLYFCGPAGMIEAINALAIAQGVSADCLHYELFSATVRRAADTAFDVVVKSSGQVVHVPSDRTIIEALEAAGLDPLYDCKRGNCGICQCAVLEGEPDHRDVILSDAEKAAGKVMQICVSRAKSPRLVLDI